MLYIDLELIENLHIFLFLQCFYIDYYSYSDWIKLNLEWISTHEQLADEPSRDYRKVSDYMLDSRFET